MNEIYQDESKPIQSLKNTTIEKASERQIRAVCYHLWQAKYNDNTHYVKEIMTNSEAQSILSFLMKNNYTDGIAQLEHISNSYR